MDPHGAEVRCSFGLERLGAHRGQEAEMKYTPSLLLRSPCSEGEPDEGEGGVLVVSPASPSLQ